MPIGSAASGRKAAKSVASSVARSVSTTGSFWWLSAVARPWPGMCLSTGKTPPSARPSAMAPSDGRDLVRRRAIGAVADHPVGAGDRHVGERQAIDIDAERGEVGRDQPGAEPRRGKARVRIAVVERAIGRARRIGRPMRRAQALHPAALLIDQHRRVAADDVREILNQSMTHFVRVLNIALEKDEPQGCASRRNARSSAVIAVPANR